MKNTKDPAQFYAESAAQPTEVDLGEITRLVHEAHEIDERLEKWEAVAKQLQDRRKTICEQLIPDLFAKYNLGEISTSDGLRVTVGNFYSAKIINPMAFNWLDENGHGGLIKTEVQIAFSRGSIEDAKKLCERLAAEKIPAVLDQSVHHSTLKAFTRELYERGEQLPGDCFTVYTGKTTKIEKKK